MLAAACLLRPRMAAPGQGVWAWTRQVALPAAVLLVCGGLTWIVDWRAGPTELRTRTLVRRDWP